MKQLLYKRHLRVSFFAFKNFGVVLHFQFQDDQIVPVISDLLASLLLVQLATNQLTDVSLLIKNDKAGQGFREKPRRRIKHNCKPVQKTTRSLAKVLLFIALFILQLLFLFFSQLLACCIILCFVIWLFGFF